MQIVVRETVDNGCKEGKTDDYYSDIKDQQAKDSVG